MRGWGRAGGLLAAPQRRGRRGAAPWEQGRVLMAAGLAERAEKGQGLHGRRAITLQPGSASCCHPADALVLLFWALLDRKTEKSTCLSPKTLSLSRISLC